MSRLARQPARASGEFAIGGDLRVVRLGYGTMQIPGPGVWGEPRDHDEVIRVLRRAIELGVTFIDTADSYGPEVSERLIHEALHPYTDDQTRRAVATDRRRARRHPGAARARVAAAALTTASLHQEQVSHRPFGAADRHSSFTPQRVTIETDDGTVLEALDQPRASFAGHTAETPWSTLQLAYFGGEAMWTYLTQPFTFAMPGFRTSELEPWYEAGQSWRRLRVIWPSYLATHSTEQTLYFNDDGLLARHDYDVEIMGGGNPGAHYVFDYDEVAGIRLPTKRRVFTRNPDGQSLAEPLIVSIDLSEIAFT